MNARPIHYLTLIFPILSTYVLLALGFDTDTEKMLALFLPIVWGIMFALGGGLVFLKRFKYDLKSDGKFNQRLSAHVITFAVILMLHTVLFLIVSSIYPAKKFILSFFTSHAWLAAHLDSLCRSYKCLLFSLIFLPSIASILVGAWSLYLVMNEKPSQI